MRGQSSFELIIVFGIALVVLVALIFNAQEQTSSSKTVYDYSVALKSVDDLAKAADGVYAEGVGSTKKVLVTIPSQTTSTSVTANSIKITLSVNGRGSDASAYIDHPLCGESYLPSTPGAYDVYVTAQQEGCVLIGTASGLVVSPSLLYVSQLTNSSQRTVNRNLTYSNTNTAGTISVTLAMNWNSADAAYVNVSLNDAADASFDLAAGASRNVTLNITLYPSAIGTYSGNVSASGNNGTTVSTDVIVDVTSAVCSTGATASKVSLILIDLYKNSTYGPQKYIFSPSENVTLTGVGFDSSIYVLLNVSFSNGTSVGGIYPTNELTNSTGGFTHTKFRVAGYTADTYTATTIGPSGGVNTSQASTFTVSACAT